ncbi:MAG: hypothetical protein GX815_12770 [Clostridiales bacterium]|nr:hypothetical protein [Clostridiales bacterium]
MEEKKTVVIQGRTIERERPSERARYSYPSRYNSNANVSDKSNDLESQGLSSAYNLSTLREGRDPSQATRSMQDLPRLERRTSMRSSSYLAGRTSTSRVTPTGPRP